MEEKSYNNPNKVYVSVKAVFYPDGGFKPIFFVWEDGREYEIARVTDIRRAASLKAGGTGIRYTCKVHNKEVYLFLEEDRWFMEKEGLCIPFSIAGYSTKNPSAALITINFDNSSIFV